VIAIVVYRVRHLTSVKKAFDHLGAQTVVMRAKEVLHAEKIVLPGVGTCCNNGRLMIRGFANPPSSKSRGVFPSSESA